MNNNHHRNSETFRATPAQERRQQRESTVSHHIQVLHPLAAPPAAVPLRSRSIVPPGVPELQQGAVAAQQQPVSRLMADVDDQLMPDTPPLEQVPAVKEARGTPLFTIADALEQQHAAKGGAL